MSARKPGLHLGKRAADNQHPSTYMVTSVALKKSLIFLFLSIFVPGSSLTTYT
ncbi:hypothetical protein LX36DRAFT_652838 [Colletotrichum falcatum]|nr:hypothetical protein LX36DRAFT_652838 [Colletotrichum falcatum]